MNLPKEIKLDWSFEAFKEDMKDHIRASYLLYKKLRAYEMHFNKWEKITLPDFTIYQRDEWVRSNRKWSRRADKLPVDDKMKTVLAQKIVAKHQEWWHLSIYDVLGIFAEAWL